jgi:hypothetical protein
MTASDVRRDALFPPPSPPALTFRVLRRYHDLKQSELGEMIGVSHSQISRLESGEQTLRAPVWRALVSKVALGDRGADESYPVHILARWDEPKVLFRSTSQRWLRTCFARRGIPQRGLSFRRAMLCLRAIE